MAWVRIDDKFAQHPKLVKAGPLGIALHVAAICYCNQHLTDGFIPKASVAGLLNFDGIAIHCWSNELTGGGEDATWEIVVDDLVSGGLWHTVEGGWLIHDYLEYQSPKDKILKARREAAERQGRWRQNRHKAITDQRNGVSNSVTDQRNGVSNGVSNSVTNALVFSPQGRRNKQDASKEEPSSYRYDVRGGKEFPYDDGEEVSNG